MNCKREICRIQDSKTGKQSREAGANIAEKIDSEERTQNVADYVGHLRVAGRQKYLGEFDQKAERRSNQGDGQKVPGIGPAPFFPQPYGEEESKGNEPEDVERNIDDREFAKRDVLPN